MLLVMFWNVENFFDPFPGNSGIVGSNHILDVQEEPFTPLGEKFWNWRKFERKRDDIARTIALVKEQYNLFPALIGLAEVENRFVLNQLTQNTILAPLGYGVIHNDSPDRRGVDVALLYSTTQFRPVAVEFVPLREPASQIGKIVPTREMLYVKGVLKEFDTLHLFVVHWPSKLGGGVAESRREEAGKVLKERCDSIICSNPRSNIIVMGDFNEDVHKYATSCADGLVWMNGGEFEMEDAGGGEERERMNGATVAGTYKYKGVWERIDHFFVSSYMASEDGLKYLFCKGESDIFAHPFLLEEDRVYLGYKVRRTLVGPRYNGGVSDHLPILLRVYGYPFE